MKLFFSYFLIFSLLFLIGCTSQSGNQGTEKVGGHGGNSNLGGSGAEEPSEPGDGRNPGGGRNPGDGRNPDREPEPVEGGTSGEGGSSIPDPQPGTGGEGGSSIPDPQPGTGGEGGSSIPDPQPGTGGEGGRDPERPFCADGPREESCNAIDDDCDSFIDEDAFPLDQLDCDTGRPGICAAGIRACTDGIEQCIQTTMAVLFEDNNGKDDDCDGQIDECVAQNVEAEVCDGIDNNCDGLVDEGLVNACGLCGPLPEESCNARDDDCDGRIDEGDPIELCTCEGALCNPPPPGAQRMCVQNDCRNILPNNNCFVRRPGFDDCIGMDNICETEILHNADHCGACGEQCRDRNFCYRGECRPFPFVKIALGDRHNCAIEEDGQVRCWGDNRLGQLGRRNEILRGDGTYQLGLGDHAWPGTINSMRIRATLPPRINRNMNYLRYEYVDGEENTSQLVEGTPQIALGEKHTCMIGTTEANAEPHVLCWGDSSYGQLGNVSSLLDNQGRDTTFRASPSPIDLDFGPILLRRPDGDRRFRPIKLTSGDHHTCAVYQRSDSLQTLAIMCWGRMDQGQAGAVVDEVPNGVIINRHGNQIALPFEKVSFTVSRVEFEGWTQNWTQLTCAGDLCCDIISINNGQRNSGNVECWGQLNLLQLGHNNSASSQAVHPINVSEYAKRIHLEVNHSGLCLWKTPSPESEEQPSIECIGAPVIAQAQIDPTGIVDFDLGYDFGCTASSVLAHCWGRNNSGQVGAPPEQERNNRLQPLPVAGGTIQTLFDAGNHNGPIVELKTGREHACVLYESGRVVCWGDNNHGQLGRPPMGEADREPDPNHIPAEPYWEGWLPN